MKEVKHEGKKGKKSKRYTQQQNQLKPTQPWLALTLSILVCSTEPQGYHQVFHLPGVKSVLLTVSSVMENVALKSSLPISVSGLKVPPPSKPLASSAFPLQGCDAGGLQFPATTAHTPNLSIPKYRAGHHCRKPVLPQNTASVQRAVSCSQLNIWKLPNELLETSVEDGEADQYSFKICL